MSDVVLPVVAVAPTPTGDVTIEEPASKRDQHTASRRCSLGSRSRPIVNGLPPTLPARSAALLLQVMMLANAGIPMLVLHLPAMTVLFVPIVFIEYRVARQFLDLPSQATARGVLWANLATTLIGVPLTWAGMLALNVATTGASGLGQDTLPDLLATLLLQSSWFDTPTPQTQWLLPAATLVLMVPYFFVSVFAERLVLRRLWSEVPRNTVTRISWRANLTTYGMLAVLVVGWLLAEGR